MHFTRFTLRQLEIFTCIARLGSVSKAAEMLSLSQSATSAALIELERLYDTCLFDRIGKRLHLNENGRLLLPRAVELLDRSREAEALLAGHSGISDLDIGATLTIGNYLATLVVADYMHAEPDRRVRLQVHNTRQIVQQVAAYELDLGLIEDNCQHPDLLVETWVEDELAVFCAPSHPLSRRGNAGDLEQLAAADWILREPGSGTRATFERAFYPLLPRLNVRLELTHTEAIKRAVESGLGIGCISRLALREAFRRGSLVELPTPGLNLCRQFNFVRHREKYLTPGLSAFLAHCQRFTAGATRSDQIALPEIA